MALADGSSQLSATSVLPAVAVKFAGAPGVKASAWFETGPGPVEVTARTSKVRLIPLRGKVAVWLVVVAPLDGMAAQANQLEPPLMLTRHSYRVMALLPGSSQGSAGGLHRAAELDLQNRTRSKPGPVGECVAAIGD